MTEDTSSIAGPRYTHTAYFFIRTGMRKGRVFGYWKNGGKFRIDEENGPFAFIDMLPRGGWDGRIRFVKFGEPRPGSEPPKAPQRPGEAGADEDGDEEFEG
jgi:hypothetical protein